MVKWFLYEFPILALSEKGVAIRIIVVVVVVVSWAAAGAATEEEGSCLRRGLPVGGRHERVNWGQIESHVWNTKGGGCCWGIRACFIGKTSEHSLRS